MRVWLWARGGVSARAVWVGRVSYGKSSDGGAQVSVWSAGGKSVEGLVNGESECTGVPTIPCSNLPKLRRRFARFFSLNFFAFREEIWAFFLQNFRERNPEFLVSILLVRMLIASSAVVADPRWMRAVQRVAGDRWPYADRASGVLASAEALWTCRSDAGRDTGARRLRARRGSRRP